MKEVTHAHSPYSRPGGGPCCRSRG